jgi:hypothetical protein
MILQLIMIGGILVLLFQLTAIIRSVLKAPDLSVLGRPNTEQELREVLEYITTHKKDGMTTIPPNPFSEP